MEAELKLIRKAIKFANLAAGEGIYIEGIGPEDFLMEYSVETGFEDWDAMDDYVFAALTNHRNG